MGRRNEGKSAEANGITTLRPHHRSMARALVHHGLRPGELAECFSFSDSHISAVLGSPAFQCYVAYLEKGSEEESITIREDIKKMAFKAIENIDEDLDVEPKTEEQRRIRQNASFKILELDGFSPKNIYLHKHDHFLRGEKEVEEIPTAELVDEVLGLIEDSGGDETT